MNGFVFPNLTIGELRKGIELVSPESRRRALERKLDELQMRWADRILPIGLDVVNHWGELAARYQGRGQSVPAIDGLIAATACAHNLVVVSHDAFFARMREHVMVYDPPAHFGLSATPTGAANRGKVIVLMSCPAG
jgi:predicted nucleic acid-binding protein